MSYKLNCNFKEKTTRNGNLAGHNGGFVDVLFLDILIADLCIILAIHATPQSLSARSWLFGI